MGGYQRIAEEAGRLAKSLPLSIVEAAAARLEGSDGSNRQSLRSRVTQAVPSPHHCSLVVGFLDRWRTGAGDLTPQAVAAALHTAVFIELERREDQSVELVWTGPDAGIVPLRRTEQVVLQVIDSASQRLLVVSYAAFSVPRICAALVRTADRGVAINVVVESPDRIEGRKAYCTLEALGPSMAARCGVYLWPIEGRCKGGAGKPGLLHVKCAVADGRWLPVRAQCWSNVTSVSIRRNRRLAIALPTSRR